MIDFFDNLPLTVIFGIFGFIWTNLFVTLVAKEVVESRETEAQLAARVKVVLN